MSNPELFMTASRQDDLQSLRERVSELDEQVTNLKRLEDTIQRNNRLFEALLAASHAGIALTGPDGTIVRVVKSLLGYGPTTLSGRSIYDVIHPEDHAAVQECYVQIVRRRVHEIHHEIRLLKPDGSVVWAEGAMTDMLDDPNVLAIAHNYKDATPRKDGEITTRELAALVEQAPFAFFSKDLEGNIQSWNRGAEWSFGYTAPEIIGRHIRELVPPELRDSENALRAIVIQSAKPVGPLHTVRVHKNGLRIRIALTLTPMIANGRVRGIVHFSQALGGAESFLARKF